MRYSENIRERAEAALIALQKSQDKHRQDAEAIQPYIDRLQRILDDE